MVEYTVTILNEINDRLEPFVSRALTLGEMAAMVGFIRRTNWNNMYCFQENCHGGFYVTEYTHSHGRGTRLDPTAVFDMVHDALRHMDMAQ